MQNPVLGIASYLFNSLLKPLVEMVTAQENKSYGQAQAAPVFQQQFIIGDVASKADVARAVRAGNQATIAAWNRRQAYGGAT